MNLKNIVKRKCEIESLGYIIENEVVECVDIRIIGHFGNAVCLEILCKNVVPMSNYSNVQNVGYILRAITELFDLSEDNGIRLSEMKNIPCRLVYDKQYRCVGIGHFMTDKFVFTSDLLKLNE